ncbi:MAG: hypothetical protein P1V20_30715 [Verrucomicrobiales bacterium]|nr:hypothetical protein [Verrucomicrobiales bacterium]
MKLRFSSVLLLVILCFIGPGYSQTKIKKEIDVGFASIDSVRPILQQVLSPQGKFVMLPTKGAVLVIDDAAHIAAAEAALAGGALPNPNVALNFAFQTGLRPRTTKISVGREVFFPTAYDPPQIPNTFFGGGGVFPITPAHPTGFVKRHIGVTSETTATVNPDGTVTMDINMENTEFEGFINYGSAILPGGQVGVVPVNGQVTNPTFFQPFVPNNILLPIISTTRISTSIVIRPRVELGAVNLDMIPRFKVFAGESSETDQEFDLKQFQTTVSMSNNGLGKVYGFANASEEFNRNFLGAKDLSKGSTAIVVKAQITPSESAQSTAP